MPRSTDSDGGEQEIVMSQRVDCPQCPIEHVVDFPTGVVDEDGLAGIDPESLTVKVQCDGHTFDATYDGWTMYGEAG